MERGPVGVYRERWRLSPGGGGGGGVSDVRVLRREEIWTKVHVYKRFSLSLLKMKIREINIGIGWGSIMDDGAST